MAYITADIMADIDFDPVEMHPPHPEDDTDFDTAEPFAPFDDPYADEIPF